MATPAHSAISPENWITSRASLISVNSEADEYPVANLFQEDRALRWHTADGATNAIVTVDLGEALTPTVLALVDLNVDDDNSGNITLAAANDADFTSGEVSSEFVMTAENAQSYNRVLRWYEAGIGNLDFGNTSRRYWKLTLPDIVSDPTRILGVWWLGTHEEFEIQEGFRIKPVFPPRKRSPGGSLRSYRRATVHPLYREIDFQIKERGTFASLYDFREKLEDAGHVLLDIHASEEHGEDDTGLAKFSAYYGLLSEEGVDADLQYAELNDLSLRFEESQAEAP